MREGGRGEREGGEGKKGGKDKGRGGREKEEERSSVLRSEKETVSSYQ